ncbi:MAG: hypothetical protein WC735_00375 [Candidatus Paceibacterota bacterium]|jgi:hypothetical protein
MKNKKPVLRQVFLLRDGMIKVFSSVLTSIPYQGLEDQAAIYATRNPKCRFGVCDIAGDQDFCLRFCKGQ